ncbi:MAG: TIM barrel protein [Rhodopseudomonas palustris]|nr:TIM barrel protein [Rhodopseudomonas palustris]
MLHNLPAGDWAAGRARHRLPSRPRRRVPAPASAKAIDYATRARRARSSTAWPASRRRTSPRRRCASTFVDNLRFAAAKLKKAGIRLLIEPINTFDIPGFYLNRTRAGAGDSSTRSASDNLYVQYDIYHAQRMEGELAHTMQKHSGAHRATCSWPTTRAATSRAPARSTTASCSRYIDRIGYDGWIGCEYKPAADHRSRGLAGVAPYAGTERHRHERSTWQ